MGIFDVFRLNFDDVSNTLFQYFGGSGGDAYNFYGMSEKDKLYAEAAQHMTPSEIEKELRHARNIFIKYDTDKSGYLDRHEIKPMMVDTYKVLNSNYSPSQKDIDDYMKMIDDSGDGKISLEEYEIFILKALRKRNIKL